MLMGLYNRDKTNRLLHKLPRRPVLARLVVPHAISLGCREVDGEEKLRPVVLHGVKVNRAPRAVERLELVKKTDF